MANLLRVFMHVMHMLLCLTGTLICGYYSGSFYS